MKRKYIILMLTVLSVCFTGCNSGKNSSQIESNDLTISETSVLETVTEEVTNSESSSMHLGDVPNGERFFPQKLLSISSGGSVPDEIAADHQAIADDITPEMLWGEWVLESDNNTEYTVEIPQKSSVVSVKLFPTNMSFYPSWATPVDAALDHASKIVQDIIDKKEGRTVYFGNGEPTDCKVGIALESMGYYFGDAAFEKTVEKQTTQIVSIQTQIGGNDNGKNYIGYSVDGDKLILGVTGLSMGSGRANSTNITELHYDMKWDGYRLTLIYDNEQVTYIPYQLAIGDKTISSLKLTMAGACNLDDSFEGLGGIDYRNGNGRITAGLGIHDTYMNTDMQFNDDGSFKIKKLDDSILEGEYLYSGETITLKTNTDSVPYSIFSYYLTSSNYDTSTGFSIGNDFVYFSGGNLQKLIDNGFQTDLDVNQMIRSCAVTPEFCLKKGGASCIVKATNPYNVDVPLSECSIASLVYDSHSGIEDKALLTRDAIFDVSTIDEVELIYNAPLRKTENSITFKARPTWILTVLDYDYNSPRKTILNSEGFEKTYVFKNGLLSEIRLEDPVLLYNGLQDNLDQAALSNMSASDTTVYLNLRDNMVSELTKAFESSSLAITLNDQTGEAVMDSNVLFAVDSSTLTEEGKQNIDQFMKTYADVLTTSENIKHVKEICFEGHTDSTGSYEYNLILSQKRAEALMQYCLTSTSNGLTDEQRKVLQSVSTAKGYSFSDPVLTEEGKEDKAASRRASIKLYVQKDASDFN